MGTGTALLGAAWAPQQDTAMYSFSCGSLRLLILMVLINLYISQSIFIESQTTPTSLSIFLIEILPVRIFIVPSGLLLIAETAFGDYTLLHSLSFYSIRPIWNQHSFSIDPSKSSQRDS